MCTHTHTHARARARGLQGRAFGPPPATTPPVGKVDLALQLTAYIHCDWTLSNASPTAAGGGAGGVPTLPLHPPRARARVCVHMHLLYFLIVLNCIKFYIKNW